MVAKSEITRDHHSGVSGERGTILGSRISRGFSLPSLLSCVLNVTLEAAGHGRCGAIQLLGVKQRSETNWLLLPKEEKSRECKAKTKTLSLSKARCIVPGYLEDELRDPKRSNSDSNIQ